MFGLSLATQIFQGSTERTWNCVSNFVQLLWNKFNHLRHPIMPKSRKRHHSRSRSRSRSHSHERNRDEKHRKNDSHDRDGKRRKIDAFDSPHQKRSVSAEREGSNENSSKNEVSIVVSDASATGCEVESLNISDNAQDACINNDTPPNDANKTTTSDDSTSDCEMESLVIEESQDTSILTNPNTPKAKTLDKLNITPNKVLSPKQLQRKLESEKKRQEKQKELDERKQKKNEEKERLKQEKLDQRKKERELKEAERLKKKEIKDEIKKKELEEKEQKKREKEEKEELKRKEKEQEKMRKMEEKNKEKIKEEEKKQKTSALFVNFFVAKKCENGGEARKIEETEQSSLFKPFEIKSDMRLPDILRRKPLTDCERENLSNALIKPDKTKSYLKDIKEGKSIGRSMKTWPYEEDDNDVAIIEEETNLGESICEDKPKMAVMRAKYLKFHENRRPAYHGTWRKKSKFISGRKPFGEDKVVFDYDVDSDDDWEEEEQGESINGSDDEEKENEPEDDYEVDNEFFVPHGHLSDDEIDDEEASKLSPEDLKQKLKLLKDEFDQDMQSKTQKLKSRSIGCVWYNKDGSCDEEAIDRYLKPLAIISNGPILIKKRCEIFIHSYGKRKQIVQELDPEILLTFLKHVHGNTNKKRILVDQFLTDIGNKNQNVEIGKWSLYKHLSSLASWKKCSEEGRLHNKLCWIVPDDVQKKYKVMLSVNN